MCHFSGPTEWQVVCIRADFQFSECDLTQLQSSWCYLPAGLWWVTFHVFRPWTQLGLAQDTLCLVWLLLTTPASRVESHCIRLPSLHTHTPSVFVQRVVVGRAAICHVLECPQASPWCPLGGSKLVHPLLLISIPASLSFTCLQILLLPSHGLDSGLRCSFKSLSIVSSLLERCDTSQCLSWVFPKDFTLPVYHKC